MNFVNLTPHPLTIKKNDNTIATRGNNLYCFSYHKNGLPRT